MKTAIIGATNNPERYAYLAAQMLHQYGYEFVPLGIKTGEVLGKAIVPIREFPLVEDIHTLTLYIGPDHQPYYYDYLIALNPKRVIFNPGTENGAFIAMLEAKGIAVEIACTLVLLRTGQYGDRTAELAQAVK